MTEALSRYRQGVSDAILRVLEINARFLLFYLNHFILTVAGSLKVVSL